MSGHSFLRNKDENERSTESLSSNTQQQIGLKVALGLSTLAGVSVLAAAPFVLQYAKSSLPYMATPRRKVIDALVAVEKHVIKDKNSSVTSPLSSMANSSNDKKLHFTDLGSGDGEAVLAAARQGWTATGVELNPTLWLISSIRKLFLPRDERRRARFVIGDLFQQNISTSHAIMIFGVKPLMPRIEEKIALEARNGSFILAYRFQLPLQNLQAQEIYHSEDMRVYKIQKNIKAHHEKGAA